jgi:catechol 2,3-dioxygenase-like lactoylglutathione lyase family enzyme
MRGGAISGLQHVALPYPGTPGSIAEARHFYVEQLGLEQAPVPGVLGKGVLWFAAGNTEIHLFPEPAGVAANSESRRHPCFAVDDLEVLRSSLTELGVETISGAPELPGRPRFFVMDPFGNVLEFLEIIT